ncbi:hypothetical protein PUN28_019454 [Cardiocondyla obscurior]|uniref:Uncharacterized protein n=1 Tax=Cardiocondyla obscurior TaxID=286306 RepID=A0AAW2EE96_9HYME
MSIRSIDRSRSSTDDSCSGGYDDVGRALFPSLQEPLLFRGGRLASCKRKTPSQSRIARNLVRLTLFHSSMREYCSFMFNTLHSAYSTVHIYYCYINFTKSINTLKKKKKLKINLLTFSLYKISTSLIIIPVCYAYANVLVRNKWSGERTRARTSERTVVSNSLAESRGPRTHTHAHT